MKKTTTFELTDDDVRMAVAQYIERQLDDNEAIQLDDIRFLVELGYSGELGGPVTQNKVEAIIEY